MIIFVHFYFPFSVHCYIIIYIPDITLIIEATSILKIDTFGPLSTTRNSTGYYLYYLRQYKSLKMERALYYLR